MERFNNTNEKKPELDVFNDYYQIQIKPRQLEQNLDLFQVVSYSKDIALLVIEKFRDKNNKSSGKFKDGFEKKIKQKILYRNTSKEYNGFKEIIEKFNSYIQHKTFKDKRQNNVRFIQDEINRMKSFKKQNVALNEILSEDIIENNKFSTIDDYINQLYLELNVCQNKGLSKMQSHYDDLIFIEFYILINPKLAIDKFINPYDKFFNLNEFSKNIKPNYKNLYNYFDTKYTNEKLLNKYLKELDLKDDSLYVVSYNEMKNSINFSIRSKVENNKKINLTVNYNRLTQTFIFTDYNDNTTKVYANKLMKIEKYIRNFKFIENPEIFKNYTIKDFFR